MNDPAAKTGLAREVLGQVNWIVVARKLGESDHVFVLYRLANRRAHADRKVFEMERPEQRVLHTDNGTFNRWNPRRQSTRRPSVDARQIGPGCATVYG